LNFRVARSGVGSELGEIDSRKGEHTCDYQKTIGGMSVFL
jgi:hypothetical protein